MKQEAEEFLVTGCQFLVTQNSKPKTQNFSKREAEKGKENNSFELCRYARRRTHKIHFI